MQATELVEFFSFPLAAGQTFTIKPKDIEENGSFCGGFYWKSFYIPIDL
jgi:hypothetical protein